MANRYWVGGSGNWSDNANHWSATSGGSPGASTPGQTDNVIFDAASNATAYAVTINGDCRCADMTWSLPGTSGVPSVLVSSGGLSIYGSLTLVAGMPDFPGNTLTFAATSTGKTITTNGVGMPTTVFNGGGGGWTLQDDYFMPGALRVLTVTNGTLNFNAKTVTCGSFVSTSGTRTLTLTGSTINITGTSGAPWNVSTTGSLTFTATGSTINFIGGGAGVALSAAFGGVTYGAVNFAAPGLWNMSSSANATFASFSYTSTTNKTDSLSWSNAPTISAGGSLTLAGNSTVNRAFVKSNTLGTQRSITVPSGATVSLTNVDFQDITSAGTFGTWTGTSLGDALGNSGITFDASTTQTYAGGTNNWSTAAAWTSRVPLPQDDVVVNTTTAGTLTTDMPRLGRNVDFTGFTRTFLASNFTLTSYGNVTLGASMTYSGSASWGLQGRGTHTIRSNGKTFSNTITIQPSGGTYSLLDDLSVVLGQGFNVAANNGATFDANNCNLTAGQFAASANATVTVKMGSGNWTALNTTGTPFLFTNPSMTLQKGTSTVILSGTTSTNITFAGGGYTYNNLYWSSTTATGTLIITGANTFNDFRVDGTTPRTVQWPTGVTNIVNGIAVTGQQYANVLPNPNMTGIVVGTPGTAPTSWVISGVTGITRQIVGSGTEDGKPYVDIRWSGIPGISVGMNLVFSPTGAHPATNRSTWRHRTGLKLVGGSLTNINSVYQRMAIYNSVGGYVTEVPGSVDCTSRLATGEYQDCLQVGTCNNAATASVSAYVQVSLTSGQPIDLTLRFYQPLVNQMLSFVSSTSGVQATVTKNGETAPTDFLALQDLINDGANRLAGPRSMNVGNNVGWVFQKTRGGLSDGQHAATRQNLHSITQGIAA